MFYRYIRTVNKCITQQCCIYICSIKLTVAHIGHAAHSSRGTYAQPTTFNDVTSARIYVAFVPTRVWNIDKHLP